MNQELIDIAIQRGRLLERISNQRQLLGQQLQPVGDALETADRAIATVRKAGTYLGQHPEIVAAGVVVLVVLQPGACGAGANAGTLSGAPGACCAERCRNLASTQPVAALPVKRRNVAIAR
jgi:hypothetical protein